MTKQIKVQYSSRYNANGFTSVPKIQMEGKWLEQLGFSIGSIIVVEYEEGSIRIRPLTAEELAVKEQKSLEQEIRKRSDEIKKAEQELSRLNMVAEGSCNYSGISLNHTHKSR